MAATAGGVRAGRAFVEAYLNADKLRADLKALEGRFKAFGSSLQSVGRNMVGIGVGAAIPFALAAKTFASFEQAMARVKALTNAGEGDFAALGERAKQLGRDTIFSATQAAQAMGNFAQAGFKVNEIMAATGPTLDLAATGQIEIAEAADIAIKVMRGMGIEATKLGGVVDVMAKAMTTSNTDLMMLGEAFKFIGPISHTAGVSLEETTAAIQMLSDAGIQGEMAGTTLRQMILGLTNPSKEAAGTIEMLGLHVNDARGNFLGIGAVVEQLQTKLAGVGTGKKLEVLGTIFSARAAGGAAALIDRGTADMRKAQDALEGSAGTAARIAATQLNTLQGAADLVVSSLETLGIEIGEALMPTLRAWAAAAVNVLNAMTAFAATNKSLIVSVAKGVVAFGALGAALFGIGVAAQVAGVALGVVGVALGLVASPLGLIVVHLGLAGAAFLALTETGRGALAALRADTTAAFAGIAEALKAGDIAKAGQILWATLKLEWQQGINFLNGTWQDWGGAVIEAFGHVSTTLAGVWVNLWAGVQSTLRVALTTMQVAWITFSTEIEKIWARLVGEAAGTSRAILALMDFSIKRGLHNAGKAFDEETEKAHKRVDRIDQKAAGLKHGALALGGEALGGIEADRQGRLRALDDQQAAADEARRAASARSIAEGEAKVKALQGELGGLLGGQVSAEPFVAPFGEATKGKKPHELTEEGVHRGLLAAEVAGGFQGFSGRGVGEHLSDPDKEAKKQTKLLNSIDNRLRRAGPLVATP